MKRVVRSKRGREIYGQKWLDSNMDHSDASEIEDDDAVLHTTQVTDIAAPSPQTETTVMDIPTQTFKDHHQSMYRATLEGDYATVEMLLERDQNLACDEINDDGDRALHVAASMKHWHMLRKLIDKMSPTDLTLLDGHGYTACCYAAISGAIDIADILIRKNPTLATIRDRENKTPLQKAALRGNTNMTSYFLRKTETKDLLIEEWFDLLLVMIRGEMYDEALRLSRRIEQLATMSNDEGTALHVLARQPISVITNFFGLESVKRAMRPDMRLLAKNLLLGIRELGKASMVRLMIHPHILDDAAKVGNVELILMLTHTYPELVWQTNNHGHTIFHTAVKYRHESLFRLIKEIGARKDLIAISRDQNGNNILHLAAELAPLDKRILYVPVFQLEKEMLWYEHVKAIVPSLCLEMKNNEGYTPKELFSERHKSLMDKSTTWMRNTAESCLLISTLIFTVAFGCAFAVPGGYIQESGIPVLFKANWFTCFVIFEALAMSSSVLSMIMFWRILVSSFEEDQFLINLPNVFRGALNRLFISVFGAISVFMSTYFLIYVERRAVLVTCVVLFVYVMLVYNIFTQIFYFNTFQPKVLFRKWNRVTLFKGHAATENRWHHLIGGSCSGL